MLTITVDGSEKKLNIGCRTFVTLEVLLEILEANSQEVTLNGDTVRNHQFWKIEVKGGDTLRL